MESKSSRFKVWDEPKGWVLPEGFSECRFIGKLPFDSTSNLVVYSFKSNKELRVRSYKREQYEIGRRILRDSGEDAGLFVFWNSKRRFRFSLLHVRYRGIRREFSSYKRYTYFVDPEEANITFRRRMEEAEFSSLEAIIDAFSVEKVTRDFYQEVANWYFWALREVRFAKDAEGELNGRNIA